MHKLCTKCLRQFPDNIRNCPTDGIPLVVPGHRDLTGEELDGRYLVRRVLEEGGMGVVYVAEQKMIGREVALKVMGRNPAHQTSWIGRFLIEARAIAQLRSIHTVTIHDCGITDDGLLFYTMELLRGETLSSHLEKNGPMSVEHAVPLILQCLESLEEAHEHDILHGDVKPANLFVSQFKNEPHITVLDFGLARLGQADSEGAGTGGLVHGTPHYISPEQALGRPTSPSSDLYSLAIVLYEMLAGVPPFSSPDPNKVLLQQACDDPLPVSLRNQDVDVPPGIEEFLQRALQKGPEDRFREVNDFRRALQNAFIEHVQQSALYNLAPMVNTELSFQPDRRRKPTATYDDTIRMPVVETEKQNWADLEIAPTSEVGSQRISIKADESNLSPESLTAVETHVLDETQSVGLKPGPRP
jgi:eukaryotic-like serine/threonine-protein kinase